MSESQIKKKIQELLKLINIGKNTQALSLAIQITKKSPRVALGWKALGAVYKINSNTTEALKATKRAVELAPNDMEAWYNLGTILQELAHFEDAKLCYVEAIKLNPSYAEAYCNLGLIVQNLGNASEARVCYLKAIELNPNLETAHNNLGNVLKELGDLENSKIAYLNAIKLNPNYYEAYNNIANVLQDLGKVAEAETFYLKCIDLKPDYYEAYSNYLLSYNYTPTFKQSFYNKFAYMFGDIISSKAVNKFTHNGIKSNHKLKIGFVSGDFRNHAIGFFLENMLSHLKSFELYAYSANFVEDDLTQRIKPYFKKWSSIYISSNEEAASIINSDDIDILVDLSGHSAHNRLAMFSYKPAPIQVSWLGYFATTGVSEIDYFIADDYVAPKSEDVNFREKLYRLPNTWLCFTPPNYNIQVNELPAKRSNFITFGCFNNLNKVNNDVIELWSQILLHIPTSKLFLKAKQLSDKTMLNSLCQKFETYEIDSNRLILEGQTSRADYFNSYNKVDIALDPFPYHGGTISVEALYMGVPVLTLQGDRFLSRVGESIAYNAKMPHWIAKDKNEYLQKAIEFSSNIDSLVDIRKTLRDQVLNSPLFDGESFADNFEKAMINMLNKHIYN
ncbi:MAG: tetratricopeptide repeat protein [Campylobacterota bacterium]|nr:tetratricopeptide repeat protein [Campylobacterota bacterium]